MSEPAKPWFAGAADPGADAAGQPSADAGPSTLSGELNDEIGEASAEAAAAAEAAGTQDSQFFFRHAPRRLVDAGGNAFARLHRSFLAARAALGVALVATQLIAAWLGTSAPLAPILLCLAYAAHALALWLLPRLQRGVSAQTLSRISSPQWWGSIGVDLTVFGLLHALDREAGVNYGALFVMPVLMAGVLTPRLVAVATAAMAALLMLGVAAWALLEGRNVGLQLTQAGLVGSGFFVISLLASELAGRLAREEKAARGSMEFARQQAQLNRLVIDEMQEGVLVVDRRGHVRAANPAARGLLTDQQLVRTAPFQLRGVAAWRPLVQAVERGFASAAWPESGQDLALQFDSGLQRSLRVRMRFTRKHESQAGEDLCVLFIEDSLLLLARNRQEKLAAMGRVSAGIAHEIRNPLAAIDQANALLSEDVVEPRAQQLTRMVASNVQRLKRIVDDVLEVAPGVVTPPVPVDASQLVSEVCLDWARTNQLAPGPSDPLSCTLPMQPLQVSFDPEHLRRVLVNLLDNALRHAEPGPASVQVLLETEQETSGGADQPWVRLSVFNAGPEIPPEVERHLFEPFFSTRSRGSGLGLYICRELCTRYGAEISYRRSPNPARPGNEFSLSLRPVASAEVLAAPHTQPCNPQ
ncbi:HAMP domain-containing sensor histidine kinase [Paucibacter sp. AS339]|uniref:sensor histidine kinase n=1 Tax=Paucibacter hankyongi TaxID=3133434 RepID=UPI003094AE84